jgi:hypothetical protein
MTVRSFLAFTVLLAGPVSAQTTIETASFWGGVSEIQPFGKPNTATYGQTFIAPSTDNVLQNFSFYLRDLGGASDLEFQGYVAAWDPTAGVTRLTGPLLYSSPIRSGPSTTQTFTQVQFDVGGLSLTAGSTYVAFISASGHFASTSLASATASWGFVPTDGTDAYPEGGFVFLNSGDNFSLLSTTPWGTVGASDLAFEMVFDNGEVPTVIPEPSTVLLMGTGMGILMLGLARKRRRSADLQP